MKLSKLFLIVAASIMTGSMALAAVQSTELIMDGIDASGRPSSRNALVLRFDEGEVNELVGAVLASGETTRAWELTEAKPIQMAVLKKVTDDRPFAMRSQVFVVVTVTGQGPLEKGSMLTIRGNNQHGTQWGAIRIESPSTKQPLVFQYGWNYTSQTHIKFKN